MQNRRDFLKMGIVGSAFLPTFANLIAKADQKAPVGQGKALFRFHTGLHIGKSHDDHPTQGADFHTIAENGDIRTETMALTVVGIRCVWTKPSYPNARVTF